MLVAYKFFGLYLGVEFFCADEGAAFDVEQGYCSFAFPPIYGRDVDICDVRSFLYGVVFLSWCEGLVVCRQGFAYGFLNDGFEDILAESLK